jgi:Spx/MgsR family transcriptional regulator
MFVLYGIPNCTSCKKARAWLEERNIIHRFHDFRKDGLDAAWLTNLETSVGWESLLNRRGTTWRRLSETERSDLTQEKSLHLMLTYPLLIKRPVLMTGDKILIGFFPESYSREL